jgi:hypothetical protein
MMRGALAAESGPLDDSRSHSHSHSLGQEKVVLSHYRIVSLSYCLIIVSSYHRIIVSSYHRIIVSSYTAFSHVPSRWRCEWQARIYTTR